MWKAVAIKELREVWWIALLALLAYLSVVCSLMGMRVFGWVPWAPGPTREIPFAGQPFLESFCVISIGFAVVLGFRQSYWEAHQGTYLFLLQRPLSRNALFVVKLLAGLAVYFVCAGAPILIYGLWAATPGTHPSPFEWSMTEAILRTSLVIPLLYLGAFLSGLRPARWYATRLLPLAGTGLAAVLVWFVPWWIPCLMLFAALYGLLIGTICHVARTRDY